MRYRRAYTPCASCFFALNVADRSGRPLTENIDALRDSFRAVRKSRPFVMDAICMPPDHLHLLMTLPREDADFATRITLIKQGFSPRVPQGERISASREYSAFGIERELAGSGMPGIALSNAYRCADGGHALIAGNSDSIFRRLMTLIQHDDLGQDPALADNAGRVARVTEINAAIAAWTAQRTVDEVLAALEGADVPAGRIYTVADIAADPHYRARHLQQVQLPGDVALDVPGICPKLSATPGGHRRNAPALGQDTDAVLKELGLTDEQIAALKSRGIVS